MRTLSGSTSLTTGKAFERARVGVSNVQALVNARPRERHRAAMKLHDVLAQLQKEERLAILHDVDVSEGVFAQLLADRHGLVRSVAARIIGYTGNTRWVPMLTSLIAGDADPFVRTRAVEALGNLGAVDAIPTLARIADDRSHPARYHAVRALGQLLPLSAEDLLSIAFDHDDGVMRRVASETIARLADAAVWSRFEESARQARPADVRTTFAEGLGLSRAPRAAAPVARMLADDPSPSVRAAAAQALGTLRDPRTLGALFDSALYDPFSTPKGGAPSQADASQTSAPAQREYPVREAAAEAILMLGGEHAWEDLLASTPNLAALPER